MTSLRESIKQLLTPVVPLPAGIFHYQAPPDAPMPYRLHLRLEPDGTGILVVNASTVLHLNETASEYAYHLIQQTPEDQLVRELSRRYRVGRQKVLQDFQNLKDRIMTLIDTPDLDPQIFLDFERSTPYAHKLSAPLRLDCAITYKLPDLPDTYQGLNKRVDRELSTKEWIGIFDKAWSIGVPHIIMTGGEPTLRSDLFELISHTESNGQVAGLLSDGIKMAEPGYLQSLLQTGLDHLLFMINPGLPDSWKALENLLAADLFVAVHHTITLQNVMDASQVLERLWTMGVKSISLSASDPSLNTSLMEYRNKAAEIGLSLVWDLPVPYSSLNPISLETQVDNPPAGAGNAWLYIEPDGDVLPAQGVNHVLGNILRDSWETIWR